MPDPNKNIQEWRLLQKILPSRNAYIILGLEGARLLLHVFKQEKQLLCGNSAMPGKKVLHNICLSNDDKAELPSFVVWLVG